MQDLAAASQLRLLSNFWMLCHLCLSLNNFESHNLQHGRLASGTSGQAVRQCLSECPGRVERIRVGF